MGAAIEIDPSMFDQNEDELKENTSDEKVDTAA